MWPTTDADAEAEVLTTEAGRALLTDVARVERPGPADLARWRKGATAAMVAAALRLASGRRRGASKFARADRMWFDPTGLEQATAEPVARHKAQRFAGKLVTDLCSGIGGDTLALAAVAEGVLAVDADQGRCRRTRWNARVYEVADHVAPICARAESFAIHSDSMVHIDPDRRAGSSTRARSIHDYLPGLDFLRTIPRLIRGGAMKFGPASDFDAHFGPSEFEVELVSLGGECKEATLWFGDLVSCRRRATRLPEGLSWTDGDGLDGSPALKSLSQWIFDPDPALIRSGLLDGFAAANGLAKIDARIDLLTAPSRLASPFVTPFEVVDVLPLDLKRLRRLVADRRLGPLEIKPRGLAIRPETFRAQLRPRGPNPATLLLVGGLGPGRAILARRDTGAGRDKA